MEKCTENTSKKILICKTGDKKSRHKRISEQSTETSYYFSLNYRDLMKLSSIHWNGFILYDECRPLYHILQEIYDQSLYNFFRRDVVNKIYLE